MSLIYSLAKVPQKLISELNYTLPELVVVKQFFDKNIFILI